MDLHALEQIALGIMSGKVISLGYVDAKGNGSIRRVEPYDLNVEANKLMAFCLEKQGIRHFKLNKITYAEAIESDPFSLRYPTIINGVEVGQPEPEIEIKGGLTE